MKKYLGNTAVGKMFNIIKDEMSEKADKMDQIDSSVVKDIWDSLKGKSGIKIKIIDINNQPASNTYINIYDDSLKALEDARAEGNGSLLLIPLVGNGYLSKIIFTGYTDENGELFLRKEDLPDYVFTGYKDFEYGSIRKLIVEIEGLSNVTDPSYLITPTKFNYLEITTVVNSLDPKYVNYNVNNIIEIVDGSKMINNLDEYLDYKFKGCDQFGTNHIIQYVIYDDTDESTYMVDVTSDDEFLSFIKEYINDKSIDEIKAITLFKNCLKCGNPIAYADINQLINSTNDGIKEDAVLEWDYIQY